MRIGVVMPTYNQAAYLPEAIAGLNAQSEIHLRAFVDDASTDETSFLLYTTAAQPRDRIVTHGQNQGAGEAINSGVRALTWGAGPDIDALTWVSSDNVMYPDWLSALSEALKPGVGAVYSAFDMPGHKGKTLTVRPGPYHPDRLVSGEACYFGPSFLIRAEIWRAAGDHEGGSAHDYGHWARVEEACWAAGQSIVYVDKPLCWYRVHEEQTVKRRPDLYDAPEQRRKALERRAARTRA